MSPAAIGAMPMGNVGEYVRERRYIVYNYCHCGVYCL